MIWAKICCATVCWILDYKSNSIEENHKCVSAYANNVLITIRTIIYAVLKPVKTLYASEMQEIIKVLIIFLECLHAESHT